MLFEALVVVASLFYVEGFQINYSITCGKEIVIFSEKNIEIIAKCKNGHQKYYSSGHNNITIPINDGILDREGCQMYKFDNQELYGVTLVGCEKISSQCLNYIKKILTCSYEPYREIKTWETTLIEEYLDFEEIAVENGRRSQIKMVLHLENVLGETINGPFYVGRKARLVGHAVPTPHVAGILARNCYATNGRDRIPILVAGCGTGTVFPPYANFFTKDLQVYSPYFTMFKLSPWDNTVRFECTFILCSTKCNGGSCLKNSWREQVKSQSNHQ